MDTPSTNSNDSPPPSFHIPSELFPFKATKPNFLQFGVPLSIDSLPNARVHSLAVGITVFNATGDRILLIQRSLTDSMPGRWETPGGAVDDDDETILHGAARELWEETGLHVSKFISVDWNPWFFRARSGLLIMKFNFVAEVAEVSAEESEVQVKLDPEEHQAYVWASREDVFNGRIGDGDLTITSPEQRQVILNAFSEREKMLSQNGSATAQSVNIIST